MSTVDSQLVSRNVTLPDLVTTLRDQHAAKLDVVIPATGLRSTGGAWEIDGTGPAIPGPDGVTTTPGHFAPTVTCDAAMAGAVRPQEDQDDGGRIAPVPSQPSHEPKVSR
jgi:hypothetical protein